MATDVDGVLKTQIVARTDSSLALSAGHSFLFSAVK
jgi:hypothetical protein